MEGTGIYQARARCPSSPFFTSVGVSRRVSRLLLRVRARGRRCRSAGGLRGLLSGWRALFLVVVVTVAAAQNVFALKKKRKKA